VFRVKTDEDLPSEVTSVLKEKEYDSANVRDQGMGGWSDKDIWSEVQKESRFFITADKGFADIRTYIPGEHAGILLLRPDKDGIDPLLKLLNLLLSQFSLSDLSGFTTVVTPRGIRIRRPRQ